MYNGNMRIQKKVTILGNLQHSREFRQEFQGRWIPGNSRGEVK